MAHIRPRIILVVFVTLLFVYAHGFALRKRNVENKLNEALKVIERQKRQVRYDERSDWEQGYPPEETPRFGDTFDLPAMRDYYTRRYNMENEVPDADSFNWNSIFEANHDEDGVENDINSLGSQPVSEEELRDIFEPSQEENVDKRESSEDALLAEALEGKSAKQYVAPKSSKRANDEEFQGLSQGELEELLAGANLDFDKALIEDSEDNEAGGDGSVVSEKEIQNIFKDVDNSAEESDEDIIDDEGADVDNSDPMMFLNEADMENEMPDEDGNLTDEDMNKEMFLNEDKPSGSTKASVKRKRSNWNTYPSSYPEERGYDEMEAVASKEIEDLAAELAAAKADVKILKNFLALEEEENANLAKALNLATKSQTERSDKYVEQEIQYIKDAIQDEMDLEEIRDVLQVASELKGPNIEARFEDTDDEDAGIDFSALADEPPLDKRGYEQDIEENDMDMPMAPLEDDEEGDEEGEEDISAEDLADIILASKLKELLSQNKEEYLNDIEDKPPGIDAWYDTPVIPSAKAEDKDYYMNPLMRELYEKLQVQNMAKRGGDFDESVSCPAVDLLTDDCSFMKELGLGLDGEAAELCNRHQLCYTCGAALDLSPNDCDRGYLSESAMLCDREGGCDEDAAGLFIIMLKYHDFMPMSRVPDECASSCAADFIGGNIVTRKK